MTTTSSAPIAVSSAGPAHYGRQQQWQHQQQHPHQQQAARQEPNGGWTPGMSTSPMGGLAASMGSYGGSGSGGGLWAPSGSWRGEGWQGLPVPPSSPSGPISPFSSSMAAAYPLPFGRSSFFPSSPAYSNDLAMSVDSDSSSLPGHSHIGNMLAQHAADAFQGPGGNNGGVPPHPGMLATSVERLSKLEHNFTSNFTCCGLKLKGLHDLMEHYEKSHVLLSQTAPSNLTAFQKQPVPRNISASLPPSNLASQRSTPSPTTDSDAPHTPGMMDLEMDDTPLPSPFPNSFTTTIAHPINPSPWSAAADPNTQAVHSVPLCVPPSLLTYSIPRSSPASVVRSSTDSLSSLESESNLDQHMANRAMAPLAATASPSAAPSTAALLPSAPVSAAPSTTKPSVKGTAQVAAPAERKAKKKKEKKEKGEGDEGDGETAGEKRFRCPVEGCGKVYKQQNGLKYHLQRSINSSHSHLTDIRGIQAT